MGGLNDHGLTDARLSAHANMNSSAKQTAFRGLELAKAERGALVVAGILVNCSKTGQLPAVIWRITVSDTGYSSRPGASVCVVAPQVMRASSRRYSLSNVRLTTIWSKGWIA